ncbi:MAG: TerB family tellurite resistance protein [bacterium]
MTRAQRLAFLKVLAAFAWADGEVEANERNRIKILFNSFELEGDARHEVDALLAERVDFDDAIALAKEFAGTFALPGARRQLLDEIETLLGAEDERAKGERELLEHVRAILQGHGPVDGFVDRMRGLFSRTLFAKNESGGDTPDPEARDRAFLAAVTEDRPGADSDLQRLCADYSRRATMEERLAIIDRMFEQAAADGAISKRAEEQAHRVAHLLWISTAEYHGVRDRWRDRLA